MMSYPMQLFHLDFVSEFADDYVTCVKRHLLNPETNLKSLTVEEIDQIKTSLIGVFCMTEDPD